MKNLLVLQSGGPTAAINATLSGVVEQALMSHKIEKIYGARHGIQGVIDDNLVEIGKILSSPQQMERLIHTPGASLGSCRKRLAKANENEEDYQKIFHTLEQYNIGYLICIGGNDSMDTVVKLSSYAKEKGITEISIMGAPKTIDNDLFGMDHSPGFPSAARYVGTTFAELWQDCNVYHVPAVTIVEVMGRHVGWLAASSVLAKKYSGAPSLIYLPERAFSNEQFLTDIKAELEKHPAVVVAISEGIRYADGTLVGESQASCTVDDFGHKIIAGAGKVLEGLVQQEIGCKVRAVELSLMQRSAGHITSSVDLYESRVLGATAVNRALEGVSGEVSVLNRVSNQPYQVEYSTVSANAVANLEKTIPEDWINEAGNFVTEKMVEYLEPLVAKEDEICYKNGMPNHISFL